MPTCRKCGQDAAGDLPACPACGAIYAKVDAHIAAETAKSDAATQASMAKQRKAAEAAAREALGMSVCQQCGHIGRRVRLTRGSFALELVLYFIGLVLVGSIFGIVWGVLVLAGSLAYSIWRIASRYHACAKCQSAQIIPGDSPKGREALKAAGLIP